MNRYDLVEIIEDVYGQDENGYWNCKYKILDSFRSLKEAQKAHVKIVMKKGDILTPNGWHKYQLKGMSF